MTESKLIVEEMDFAAIEKRTMAIIIHQIITPDLMNRFKKWLTPKGIRFFQLCKFLKGTVSPVFIITIGDKIKYPHPVHLKEGMTIRNWMREQPEFKDFTAHDYDNTWMMLIEKAIEKGE